MTMSSEVIRKRGALARFRRAIRKGRVVMGFVGGSITEAHREGNWPYFVASWFLRRFPGVEFVWENAAIGGTGSMSGLMRVDRDLVSHDCDLIFIEYAVNDGPGEETFRTREGLIRRLLAEERDLVFVELYQQGMYDEMCRGEVPASVAELETLAEHYRISSVWSGLHAFNEQRAGRMSWEAWLPEGLHPEALGSSIYAEPVLALLESELDAPDGETTPWGENLPTPLNAANWESIYEIPWESVRFHGPWAAMREVMLPWYRLARSTSADGASLSFEFEGRALCAMFNFGKMSGKMFYRIDEGPELVLEDIRADWVPDKNWCVPYRFCDDLTPGRHTFQLTVRHGEGPDCKGTNCRIFTFMAVR